MPASRRSILAGAGAGLAMSQLGSTKASAKTLEGSGANRAVAALARRSEESNAALLRGDVEQYRASVMLTDDFTLMSPFGGTITRGTDMTSDRWKAMGRFFRNGTFAQELVQSYSSADIVVLVTVERAHVEVGGLPAQDWALRVTLVYRREGHDWRLVHRHADPLARGISIEEAAALARGEAA